jgi:hypothetical protein
MIEGRNIYCCITFDFSQNSGIENQVSSTTTSGFLGFPLCSTAAIDDVTITLFKEEALAQDLSTFSVPLTAGSINSAYKKYFV